MSTTTIDELQVIISANAAQFQQEMKNLRNEMNKVSGAVSDGNSGIQKAFGGSMLKIAALGVALAGIGGVIANSTKEFGAFEQNIGGAEAVFGQFADAVKQKAKDSAVTMGTSMSEYLASANKMGSLFQGAGFSVQKSMTMSTEAMQRAADVASVMGISQEMALESVAGMAKGNFTMMDNLGVAMNDTNIQAWMLEKGIQGNINAMTTAQKVGMAYEMFMDRTSKYAGNFAREATTLEGALAIMRAELSNVAATLGSAFAPVVLSVANFVSGVLVPALNAAIPYIVGFMKIIGTMVNYVVSAISGLFGAKVGGAIGGVGKTAKAASTSMRSLGGSAGGAGGGMNKAAGGAKKLKKELSQLAKFDEMNVLKTPEDQSGGSGSGGAGGGGADIPEIALPDVGGFENAFDGINTKAEEVANNIKKFFKNTFDFSPMQKSLKIFTDGVRKAIEGIVMIGEKFISKFIIPIYKFQIEKTIPMVLTAIGEALKSINFEVIAESAGNLFAEMGNLVNVLNLAFAGLIEVIAPFAAWVANFVIPPTFEFLATVIKIVRVAIEGVGYAISGLWKMIEPAFKALGEALKPVLDWLGKTLKSIRENETFMNVLKDAFTAVTIVILGPLVAALGAIVIALTAVIEIVKLVVRFFVDGWNSVVRVWNIAGSFFSNVSNNIRGAFNGIGSWFSGIFNNARNLVFNAFSGVGRWFEDRWSDIRNVFSNVWSVFSNIGSQIWNGLKNGIGNLATKMRDIFSSAVQNVKNFLGIHSPSRLFMGIGGYVGEGFSIGIEDEQKSVLSALNNLTAGFSPQIPSFILPEMPKIEELGGLPNGASFGLKFKQAFEGSISDKIEEMNEKPINLTVNVGNEKMLEQLINGINERSFMENSNVIDI